MNIKEVYRVLSEKEKEIKKELDPIREERREIFKKLDTLEYEIYILEKAGRDVSLLKKEQNDLYKKLDEVHARRKQIDERLDQVNQKKDELWAILDDKTLIEGMKVDLYKQVLSEKGYRYRICLHGTKQDIGYIEYRENMEEPHHGYMGDVGYHIEEKYRCRGYASEALKLLTDKLYKDGINNVYIATFTNNLPSIRVIEKFGGKIMKQFSDETGYCLYNCDLVLIKNINKR